MFRRSDAIYRRLRKEATNFKKRELSAHQLTATFFGVSTILFDDGETRILIDGFFSRPSPLRVVLLKLQPNEGRIRRAMADGGITALSAILVSHSHYDHAMDAPALAAMTGATVYGSSSTKQLMIGERNKEELEPQPGHGSKAKRVLEDGQFRKLTDTAVTIRRFTIRAVQSGHSPCDRVTGDILRPLVPPARRREWRTGNCYSLVIGHSGRNILVHGSAGFIYGALDNVHVDTLYLGIARLGTQPDEYKEAYWREVVEATNPRLIIPVHWDNFTRSLDRPLRRPPVCFDDVPRALEFIKGKCDKADIALKLAPRFVRDVPWRDGST